MFREERNASGFDWSMIGDLQEGRPNLGLQMDVRVYRLMQFTLRDVMIQNLGVDKTDTIFYLAGRKAGEEFYRNLMGDVSDMNDFVIRLQALLKELGIGVLRVEHADAVANRFILTVAEDLDCSGLPICGEEICVYDEGFISGLFFEHTGLNFNVREVDCWCSGDRVCRFEVSVV